MLRLTEEMVVFLLEGDTGAFIPIPDETLDLLLVGSILIDLELEYRIKIDTARDAFMLTGRIPLGCSLVDPVLEDMVAINKEYDNITNWQGGQFWVKRLIGRVNEIRGEAIGRLVKEGILVRSDEWGGGKFRFRNPGESGTQSVSDVRKRVMRVLFENEKPNPKDIAIICLCDACDIFPAMLSKSEMETARARIKAVYHMDIIDFTVAHTIGAYAQPETRKKEIPVLKGYPLIGSIPQIYRNPGGYMVRMYRTHGPVFRQKVMGHEWTYLVGPEANFFLMRKGHLHLSSRSQYEILQRELETHLFPFGTDGSEHIKLRRGMSKGLSKSAVVGSNIPRIIEMIRREISGSQLGRPVTGMRFMQGLISEQLGSLCGKTSPREYTDDLILFIHTILMRVVFRRYFFNRAFIPRGYSRARERVREFICEVLDEHRHKLDSSSEEDSTLIDDLIRLHRRDPTFMTEKAMEANALVPYLAGLDTAAGMSAFTLFYVLRSPELRERARAEADALFASGTPTLKDVERMDVLPRVAKEVMRLHPPVPALTRTVTNSFTLMGHRFPAGKSLIFPVCVAHALAEFFPEPWEFDIDRYTKERGEHKQLGIYTPFGVGQHRCMGAQIAEAQMSLTLATLLRYADMELDPPDGSLKTKSLPTPRPVYKFRFTARRPVPETG